MISLNWLNAQELSLYNRIGPGLIKQTTLKTGLLGK